MYLYQFKKYDEIGYGHNFGFANHIAIGQPRSGSCKIKSVCLRPHYLRHTKPINLVAPAWLHKFLSSNYMGITCFQVNTIKLVTVLQRG